MWINSSSLEPTPSEAKNTSPGISIWQTWARHQNRWWVVTRRLARARRIIRRTAARCICRFLRWFLPDLIFLFDNEAKMNIIVMQIALNAVVCYSYTLICLNYLLKFNGIACTFLNEFDLEVKDIFDYFPTNSSKNILRYLSEFLYRWFNLKFIKILTSLFLPPDCKY